MARNFAKAAASRLNLRNSGGNRLDCRLDCERVIGNERYYFFLPIEVGDFVMHCWAEENKLKLQQKQQQEKEKMQRAIRGYTMLLYENGEQIDPKTDPRFSSQKWGFTVGNELSL